ncbi:MAG: trypsin-like peptidase domain-containing protein [Cyclobacteriaceae bacterium]|nr:trypsin-like peptidase domain-containing protein [Cyclobacteriaceae bacterium]
MFLGITENQQEKKRVSAGSRIRLVTVLFSISLFMPFFIYSLFYFDLVRGRSSFDADLQQPVAKVVTSSGIGTAFMISPTILLTARHVLGNEQEGDEVELIFEQSDNQFRSRARIKYIAPTTQQPANGQVTLDYFLTDLAVLETDGIDGIEPLLLGESDAVVNLDEVILIGYPHGDYSITKGNINSGSFRGFDLFKLDASSNPGNSGGPCILGDDHTVIGILVGGSNPDLQGENVALKINQVKAILRNEGISY